MTIHETTLPGVVLLEPNVFRDERGFFTETFSTRDVQGSSVAQTYVQDNHSRSSRGVLRGLHYQLHSPQGKLVHVARGRVFDVAVDIRIGSPHFGKWFGTELDDENLKSLWVPPGFAHGFCVLSETADVIYTCTALYDGKDDRGVAWNDPAIGIDWPTNSAIVSEKDAGYEGLSEARKDLPRYS